MLISLKDNFVFFCTPKCASNSVEAMLKPHTQIHLLGTPAVRHINVRDFNSLLEPFLKSVAPEQRFERVAIIREPISWLYSWYRFRSRSALREAQSANSTAHITFAEFVDAFLSEDQPEFARLDSQLRFLTDESGSPGVDYLFAFEKLDELTVFFSKRIGKTLSLSANNVSPSKVYKSNLTERLASLKRGIQARMGVDSRPQKSVKDPRGELSSDQVAQIEKHFSEEMSLYQKALNSPML